MDDPFERSRLSGTSLISLAVLFGANLLIIFYFVTATEEPVPAPVAEPSPLAGELRLLNELSKDQMAVLTGTDQPEAADEPAVLFATVDLGTPALKGTSIRRTPR